MCHLWKIPSKMIFSVWLFCVESMIFPHPSLLSHIPSLRSTPTPMLLPFSPQISSLEGLLSQVSVVSNLNLQGHARPKSGRDLVSHCEVDIHEASPCEIENPFLSKALLCMIAQHLITQ